MNKQTLDTVKEALNRNSIYSLFTDAIGVPEEIEENDTNSYALMFNVETEELFFLYYETRENSWAKTAESQNHWILLGYVSATDTIMNDPSDYISDQLDYYFEQRQQY